MMNNLAKPICSHCKAQLKYPTSLYASLLFHASIINDLPSAAVSVCCNYQAEETMMYLKYYHALLGFVRQ